MSSGLECEIFETEPGKWFYLLQDWNCPASCWDWRDHSTCHGAFATDDEAFEHLMDNHANPGGFRSLPYETLKQDNFLDDYRKIAGSAREP